MLFFFLLSKLFDFLLFGVPATIFPFKYTSVIDLVFAAQLCPTNALMENEILFPQRYCTNRHACKETNHIFMICIFQSREFFPRLVQPWNPHYSSISTIIDRLNTKMHLAVLWNKIDYWHYFSHFSQTQELVLIVI